MPTDAAICMLAVPIMIRTVGDKYAVRYYRF
jgi:hypothetical protein